MEVILIDLLYVAIIEMRSACNKLLFTVCCYLKGAQ
jgi:hypothetical protein